MFAPTEQRGNEHASLCPRSSSQKMSGQSLEAGFGVMCYIWKWTEAGRAVNSLVSKQKRHENMQKKTPLKPKTSLEI